MVAEERKAVGSSPPSPSEPASKRVLTATERATRELRNAEHTERLAFAAEWADFRGYVPHAGQLALHGDPRRNRTLRKGRRGGGTTAAAFEAEVELQLWRGEIGEGDIGIFAPTVKKTEILYGMVHDSLITQRRLGVPQVKRATFAPGNRRIETAWGSRLIAWSLDEVMPAEGFGLRLAIVDESQGLPWDVFWSSIRPALSDKQGRSLFVGKAAGVGFRRLVGFGDKFPDEWGAHKFVSTDNPIVTPEEVEQARREMPEWLFYQEYLAEFADLADAVFTYDAIMACVDDSLRLDSDAGAEPVRGLYRYVDGWDLAKKQDRTVGITIACTEEPLPVVEYWRGYREPWPAIGGRIAERQRAYESEVWLDATGLGDVVLDHLEVPTGRICNDGAGYVFTPKSKQALLYNLQSAIEHRRIRFPRIPQLLRELEEYRFDDAGLETDTVMALALAVMGATGRREASVRWLD